MDFSIRLAGVWGKNKRYTSFRVAVISAFCSSVRSNYVLGVFIYFLSLNDRGMLLTLVNACERFFHLVFVKLSRD